jgi:diguanylate cyclase (GGDEF)-like protein/PAS domain S-box-containing protein
VLAVALVLIIYISAACDFDYRVDDLLSAVTMKALEADTITNVNQINLLFESKYTLLNYIANSDAVRGADVSEVDFGTNMPGFLRMYIYRADGNGYCNKKFLGNFAEHDFFQTAMGGQENVYVSAYSGSDEFVFNVPVKDDYGNVCAVLSGVCSSMMIYNSMKVNHGSDQRVCIYDSMGRIVLSDPSLNDENIKKVSDAANHSEDALQAMKGLKNGTFEFKYHSDDYKVVYNRLDTNNWYIVSVDTVSKTLKHSVELISLYLLISSIVSLIIIAALFILQRRSYREQLSRVQEETSMLTKTIPGSSVMCKLDELLTIKYASETMYTKLGYISGSDNLMSTLGLREIIHPDDLKGFNKLYDEFKNTSSKFEYECRFICKNGRPRWMNCYARFVNNINGIKNLYLVAIDISEQKEAEQRLQISEQRYKVVIKQSNSIVFEYNIKSHEYFVTNNFYEIFSVSANSGDIFAVFMKHHRLHSDDKFKFEQMISDVYSKCGFREEELRIMDSTKKYEWYSLKITSISDNGSAPARIIGNLSNIDAQKRSTIELVNQTQLDSLTGCLNRETTLSFARKLVENETEDALCALIVIDIDHFRQINDKYGIEVGDELLKNTGRMLKTQVRSSDIVGRIGDDEFLVFLRGCTAVSQITAKVQNFVNEAHNITAGAYTDTTYSVGAAIYPMHTRDYDELYDKADKAVYISKTTGYDKYTIYDAEHM